MYYLSLIVKVNGESVFLLCGLQSWNRVCDFQSIEVCVLFTILCSLHIDFILFQWSARNQFDCHT